MDDFKNYTDIVSGFCTDGKSMLDGRTELHLTAGQFSELCEAHTRKVVESALENMPAYRSIADKYVLPDGSRLSPDAIEEALYKFAEDIKANSSPFKFISTKETAK